MLLEANIPLAACRPPRGFREVEGVREARPMPQGPFGSTPTNFVGSPAQKAGLRYERHVHAMLDAVFPGTYRASQWYQYRDRKGILKWCQPDGVLLCGSLAVVFEVKARFCAEAWWQLRRLYSSVILCAHQPSVLGLCVVCKSYDPSVPFPERHVVVDDIEGWVVRRQFAEIGRAHV